MLSHMSKNPTHPLIRILFSGLLFVALAFAFGLANGQDQAVETPVVSGEVENEVDPVAAETPEPESMAGEAAVVEEEPGLMDFLSSSKYIAFLAMIIAGVVLMLGRWVSLWVRVGMMGLAFVLFGLDYFFPLHPSPMCAITKLFMFKITWGTAFQAFLAMFVAIVIPSLFGRKLFCGWVCPLGALQDLVNKIPFKWRRKQFNFGAFNALRFGLLLMFILTFFAVKDHIEFLGQKAAAETNMPVWTAFSAYSIYDPINFFELLHWDITTMFVFMMGILIAVSLILWRPFCYAICPVGAVTWLLERVAPLRVRVNQSKCNDCGLCVTASPCPTIKPMVENSRLPIPDCMSCGECLDTCNRDAITFKLTA